ncbi:hypothetical protein M405DRAFT_152667 [Rhizopogon salebrosus TDB-379]|nr:hypothetical protein M405DRAFT_152667 [Rhizopogon salebrosus TDB-379]
MFVITPVSALQSYSCHPHYRHPDQYLAQQRAEQCARAEARIRRHRQKQLILNALRAQEYDEYSGRHMAFYGYGYPSKRHCPVFDHEAEIRQARRQAVLKQAIREREAHLQELRRLAAIEAQCEEQKFHARRRADTEKFLSLLLNPELQAQSETPTQPLASASKPPVQDEPSPKHRLEERLMNEYESALRSLFSAVSGGNSSEAPVERIPVVSPAAATTQGEEEGNAAPAPSQDKGKGKAKEFPQSDSEEEPSTSPTQIASSLSQITSIASRLETLLANFQFPAELDFSPARSPSPSYSALDTNDEYALTYTPTNTPLRAQEHALSLLLSELDDVPSFGSRVVKDARRAVVARVEEALEELEKGVEERRGRARAREAVTATVESVHVQDVQSTPVNAEPGVETTYSMDIDATASPSAPESADLSPIVIPIDDVPGEVSEAVDGPIIDASADGSLKVPVEAPTSAPMEIDPLAVPSSETSIEESSSTPVSVGLTSATVTEPSVASSDSFIFPPTSPRGTSSEDVSETLTIQVSVPHDEPSRKSEELPVDTVSMISDVTVGEGVVTEQADPISVPGAISVAISASMPSTHTYPAEVVNTPDNLAMESSAHSSPQISETGANTFLLASRPASPSLAHHDSEDDDGVIVVVDEHENEGGDEWSDVEA